MLPLLALTTFLALYLSIDINAFRDDIAAEIEAYTGREVVIAGDLDLALSLHPTLVAKNVAFGNADWGSKPQMLNIGRLEGRVALLPLLSGRLEVRHIELVDTELLLETDPLGRGNWLLHDTEHADTGPPATLPVIDRLRVANLQLIWRDNAKGESTEFAVDGLTLTGIGKADPVLVTADTGGGPTPGKPVWSLRLRVHGTDTGYRISELTLAVGDSDIGGDLEFTSGSGHRRLTGRLSSRQLQLDDFANALSSPQGTGHGADAPGERANRVFSSTPFGVAIPASLRADLSYQVQRLGGPALALENISTRIRTDRGVLSVGDIRAQWDAATITADLVFDTGRERPSVQLQLAGRDIHFGNLIHAVSGEQWLDAEGDLDIQLQGSGRSLAEIMANVSGTSQLLIGKGYADVREVDTLIGGLGTALRTLVDQGTDRARLNCIASSFEVDKGVATSRLLLADTEHSTVYGEGSIDFRSERLDLILKPKPKSMSLNVAVPIEIGGTLVEPSFTPEKLATARKGAGILAAVGFISFPPAILLGLGELGSGDANPCLELATEAGNARAAAKQSKKPQDKGLVERTAGNVEAALDDIGSAIKGLFK